MQKNMDMQSSSESFSPKPGDLVWAKMKGFPPWPAKVLEKDKNTPLSRVPIIFFGTGEKAFMKPSDLFDYYEHKAQYEVPRKHKGFNEGVREIRVEAGLQTSLDDDPLFATSTSNKIPSPILLETASDELKTRSFSGKMLAEAFLSGCLDGTDYNVVVDDDFNLLGSDDAKSNRSKRSRASSKLYDDFLLNELFTKTRHRSGSASEAGRRSRLMSGVSDVFDELLYNGEFNLQQTAEQLIEHTLDEVPLESSGEESSDKLDAVVSLSSPVFCSGCGSECRFNDAKWRCTSKCCNRLDECSSCHEDKMKANHVIPIEGPDHLELKTSPPRKKAKKEVS
ncbi:PWWP domain protein [Dictyocaulus viviparus]|uniref:PWWP domain protein n=1 Tax=Dictyocaulus viviparus TaxID=29172 RepID=A0A0D8XGD9_DICVI|nr:PWWP domain protein [Dictyocaulus viviparus]